MENEVLIQVDQVSRNYGEYRAVDNISFTVQRGEVLGFLGPNGAGKSTTMQIITGVLTPSAGQVSIAGKDILETPMAAKSHIGFLPESPPLYTDLTVDEYLHYTARLRRIKSGRIREAVEQSKQRCGLKDVGHRLIGNLSKGYQQRVGIAQAIIHSPSVVILDEPTSGLDPIQILEIRELIRQLGSDHSVILSTHILSEVQTVCNRVLIIHQGKLVLDEQLETLKQRQKTALKIALRQPPPMTDLKAIAQVTAVEQIDDQHFRIHFKEGENIHDDLSRRALDAGWGLYEMMPDDHSLEETFVLLTQTDTPTSEVVA